MKLWLFRSRNLLLNKHLKHILTYLWNYVIKLNPKDTVFSIDLVLIYNGNERLFIENFQFTSLDWMKFFRKFRKVVHTKLKDINWIEGDFIIGLEIKSPDKFNYEIPWQYKLGRLP